MWRSMACHACWSWWGQAALDVDGDSLSDVDIEKNNAVYMSQVCKNKASSKVATLICICTLSFVTAKFINSIYSTIFISQCAYTFAKLQGIHSRCPSGWRQEYWPHTAQHWICWLIKKYRIATPISFETHTESWHHIQQKDHHIDMRTKKNKAYIEESRPKWGRHHLLT